LKLWSPTLTAALFSNRLHEANKINTATTRSAYTCLAGRTAWPLLRLERVLRRNGWDAEPRLPYHTKVKDARVFIRPDSTIQIAASSIARTFLQDQPGSS